MISRHVNIEHAPCPPPVNADGFFSKVTNLYRQPFRLQKKKPLKNTIPLLQIYIYDVSLHHECLCIKTTEPQNFSFKTFFMEQLRSGSALRHLNLLTKYVCQEHSFDFCIRIQLPAIMFSSQQKGKIKTNSFFTSYNPLLFDSHNHAEKYKCATSTVE